ncbi:MAG: hypothetical protein AAF197_11120 [Pseudomonadota bacterium]
MRSNKSIFSRFSLVALALLSLSLVSSNIAAQSYTKIKRLGTSQSMCPGGAETVAELQSFVENNPAAFADVVASSGSSVSASAVVDAIMAGNVTLTSYPVGTKMAWMGAKQKGDFVALPYREWAGATSFSAFEVVVEDSTTSYTMAIPTACCNLALLGAEALPAAPVCDCGDLSGCATPAEADAKAEECKPAPELGWIPFIGAFAGTETRPRFETAWQMDMRDSSGIIGLRAGLMKELSEKNSVFGQISYYDRQGINGGNVYPEDNLAIDVGFERKLSGTAFIGGGVGIWNIDDSDFRDASVFGHVGANFGKSNWQWFLEGRVFDSDSETLDSISDNRMFSAGIRYLVK